MADARFQTIGRLATAAIYAVAMSLAHAQPDAQSHPGSVRFRQAAGGTPYLRVSGNARNVPPHSNSAAYMRAGSIRDAVTRYNEEREAGHIVPRSPNDDAHPPDPSIYRN